MSGSGIGRRECILAASVCAGLAASVCARMPACLGVCAGCQTHLLLSHSYSFSLFLSLSLSLSFSLFLSLSFLLSLSLSLLPILGAEVDGEDSCSLSLSLLLAPCWLARFLLLPLPRSLRVVRLRPRSLAPSFSLNCGQTCISDLWANLPPPLMWAQHQVPAAGPQQLVICPGTSTGIASGGEGGAGPAPLPMATRPSRSHYNSTGKHTIHKCRSANLHTEVQNRQLGAH